MNGQQLIDRVRMKTQDLSNTKFWSDEEILFNINEAMKEAAVRSELIYDKSSLITVIPSVIDQAGYSLDPLIFLVKKVRFNGKLLEEVKIEKIDRYSEEMYTTGDVRLWYVDQDDKLYLYKKPSLVADIQLEVFRLPNPITTEDECEIPLIFQDKMLSWAYKLCYEKLDAEVSRPELAAFFDNEFSKVFPTKSSTQWKKQRRSTENCVRYYRF